MAITFPTTIDDFTNPISSNPLNNPSHSEQHQNINDAVEALEAKVGVNGSAVTTSHDYKIAQLESGKEDSLGFTPENVANKVTSFQATPDDTAYPSEKLVKESLDGKQDALVSGTNIKTINDETLLGSGNIVISGGGSSLWTTFTGTRASNTTITVSGDHTATFKKGMVIKWTDGNTHVGMVSIPSTESGGTTTITIIGDVCSADATDFSYCLLPVEKVRFAVAGNIGAVADDIANAYYATEPMRVLGADLQVGTAGTTNSTTIDIDKATTTMFTTKPTLATTVASSPTPFTADDNTSLALGDRVRINIDAIQTTNAIDLYVQLYLFPTRYLSFT